MYFAKQYTAIENDSFRPAGTNCLCDAAFLAVDFENQDFLKIIWALDIKKAHDHDSISTGIFLVWKTIAHNIL